MARISNFIYCMGTDIGNDIANISGVLSAITPDYIPGTYSFSILFSILDLDEGEHKIKIKFISPDETVLVNIEECITYEKNESINLPKEHVGINIASEWRNVLLEKSGIYKTTIILDDVECGVYDIFAKGKNEVI